MKKKYNINDLDCAACSVKIEKAINEFEEIDECTLDFINKKLYIETSKNWQSDEELVQFLEKIIHIFEKDVSLSENDGTEEEKVQKTNFFKTRYFTITKLTISTILLLIGWLVPMSFWWQFSVYLVANMVVGYEYVIAMCKKFTTKHFIDENFLMILASIGGFIIGAYEESVMVILLYCLGEMFQKYAVDRSRKSITDMLKGKVQYATVIKDGEEHQCKPEKLSLGDRIVVKKGDRVPVDSVVVNGNGFVDTSMLTGESKPQRVQEGSKILAGCINTGNTLVLKVAKKFEQSAVAKIMDLVEMASAHKPKSEKFISKFARIYTPVIVGCALVVAFVPPIFVGNLSEWVYRALTFLVVSCPCAIVISVPLTFFSGLGVSAKSGIMIKGANVLEILPKVSTIVFDKTGTLTKGVFEVQKIETAPNVEKDTFIKFLCYAESRSGHPIAKSVMKLYKGKIFASKINSCEEIGGLGIKAHIENKNVVVGSHAFLTQEGIEAPEVDDIGSIVYVGINGVYAGHVVISDSLKPNVKTSLNKLKQLGVKRFIILTGDEGENAFAVAKQLDINEVYANLMPEDKLTKLAEIMESSKGKVMYVGDGVNDAPVLMASDIGVSMGKNGSDIAIESGDLVLMKDDIFSLVKSIKIARKTVFISYENIVFALAAKLVVLVLGFLGLSTLWLAVFADVGVSVLAILNAIRMLIMYKK